jgi:hypothetical protein
LEAVVAAAQAVEILTAAQAEIRHSQHLPLTAALAVLDRHPG